MPLTRALLVFGVGALTAYFGGFMLILQGLRKIFRTLTAGDPFHPDNVRRLRQIGLTLALVTGGVWVAQGFVAARLAPGGSCRPGVPVTGSGRAGAGRGRPARAAPACPRSPG